MVRILHVSDIHYPDRDADTVDALKAAIDSAKPDFVVASGDFANHPWEIGEAARWFNELLTDHAIDADHVIVVPGNHDYRVYGNFGFRPLTKFFFNRHFQISGSTRIRCFPNHGVTFFKFDTNPVAFGFARGSVTGRQLRKLTKEYDQKDAKSRDAIRGTLRIAVMHHHPLPQPNEGNDVFLALRNANGLLQFLAEKQIDIVLHGHKHRAPYSQVRLGTTSGFDRVIDVIAAGTAISKSRDIDKRGNHFNLITIDPGKLCYIEQYFSNPAAPTRTFIRHAQDKTSEYFLNACHERSVRASELQIGSLDWDVSINDDGDGRNEFIYRRVRAGDGRTLPSLDLPPFQVPVGYLSDPVIDTARSHPNVTINPRRTGHQEVTPRVSFSGDLHANPVDFVILAEDFNCYCMDQDELDRRPAHADDPNVLDKKVDYPIERFSMTVHFPPSMELQGNPWFEAQHLDASQAHSWLTDALSVGFRYSSLLRIASFQIQHPPVGYRYLIRWKLRNSERLEVYENARDEVIKFASALLRLRERRWETHPADQAALMWEKDLSRVLVAFYREVQTDILGDNGSLHNNIDISLMVADYNGDVRPYTLRVVAGTGVANPQYRNFSLPVGDGLAGLAYKKVTTRVFSRHEARFHPAAQTYVPIPGFQPHEILFSIPIRNPRANAHVFAVLNLGAFDKQLAGILATMDNEEGHARLLEKVQSYLLPRLLETLPKEG